MSSPFKTEKVFLRFTQILICLIPFLPLFVSHSLMFPFITGKNFAFRVLVEIAAVFWLCLITINKEYRLHNSTMILYILVFTFIVGLADLLGVNPFNSFWSNYERMEGYITILHILFFFLMIKSIFKTRTDWIVFLSIFVVVSVFVDLFSAIEHLAFTQTDDYILEYGTRIASTMGNPPFLASYLLFSVFLGLILTVKIKNIYLKIFYIFSVAVNIIVMYMTGSRGAILAGVIGAAIIGMFVFMRKPEHSDKKRHRTVFVLVITGLLLVATAVFLVYQNYDVIKNDKTVSRFMMMLDSDPSVNTRLYAWKLAWNGIKENPFLGWGQENFIGVYKVNLIPHEGKIVWVDRAHNIIIDWLINAGILGLISYLAIFGAAFYILWNNFRKKILSGSETLILFTSLVVYFLQNLVTFDTISTYVIFFTLLGYIDNIESIDTSPSLNIKDNISAQQRRLKSFIVALCTFITVSFGCYYLNYIPVKQLKLYTDISLSLDKYDSFSTMLEDFNEALSYGFLGDNYIREEMSNVSRQIIDYNLYEKEGALKLIQAAALEIEKGIAAEHHNLEFITKAIYFFRLIAIREPSFISITENLIDECLRQNPQYHKLEMAKVDILIIKKDYERSFDYAKKIVESNPENDYAQFKLALTAILTSREKVIDESIENVKKIRIVRNKNIASGKTPVFLVSEMYKLAQAYIEVKRFDKAMQYYREIITILPLDYKTGLLKDKEKLNIQARFHLEIARIYVILNDKENAVKEAEKAAKLDPDNFADKVKIIIDSFNNKI